MSEVKEIRLRNGGLIHYRLPNVLEQLEFFSESGWYADNEKGEKPDIYARTLKAIDSARKYILDIEGPQRTVEELISDRDNMQAFTDLAWDIAAVKLSDDEKKP